MLRTGLRVMGLSLVALAVLFVAAAPARAANVNCGIGEEIVVANNADTEPAVCEGGTPTVFSIDRIVYSTAGASATS